MDKATHVAMTAAVDPEKITVDAYYIDGKQVSYDDVQIKIRQTVLDCSYQGYTYSIDTVHSVNKHQFSFLRWEDVFIRAPNKPNDR